MRPLAASLMLFALGAIAQPREPACYEPLRTTWAGPRLSLGCLPCCGCRDSTLNMEWTFRAKDAGWNGTEMIYAATGRFSSSWPRQPLAHMSEYCMRVRFLDGMGAGAWGPSNSMVCGLPASDLCFTWDDASPTMPAQPMAVVTPGTNQLSFSFMGSSDDGGGVESYLLHYQTGEAQFGFGTRSTSPVTDVLGAGAWTASVMAVDFAGNRSARTIALPVTFGFDAAVPVPAQPRWPNAVSNELFTTAVWPDDAGADSWVITTRLLDGGWRIANRPRVPTSNAYLDTPGPCLRHVYRIGNVFGTQASDWSAPSPELLTDTVAPMANAPTIILMGNGLAELRWTAASDGCPSGLSYRVERSANDGGWMIRLTTAALTANDPLDTLGAMTWRVVAIDGAGNEGTSGPSATIIVSADAGTPDAGVDAGTPDAGADDAGVEALDAGVMETRRTLGVGCSCTHAEELAMLLFTLSFLFRSRTRIPFPSERLRVREKSLP